MDHTNPLGLTVFDAADFLDSEEAIAALMEAAHESVLELVTPAERAAHIQRAQEACDRARARWALQGRRAD